MLLGRAAPAAAQLEQRAEAVLARELLADVCDRPNVLALDEYPLICVGPVDEQPRAGGRPFDITEGAGAGEQESSVTGMVDVDDPHLAPARRAHDDRELVRRR